MPCRQAPAGQGTHGGLWGLIPGDVVSTGAWARVHRSPRQVCWVRAGGKKAPRVPKGHGLLHLTARSPECPYEPAGTPADLGSWEEAQAGPVAGATHRTRELGGAAAGRAEGPQGDTLVRSSAKELMGGLRSSPPRHPQMSPGQLFRMSHYPQGTADSISLSGKTVRKHSLQGLKEC